VAVVGLQPGEAEVAVEAQGAVVSRGHVKVNAARAPVAHRRQLDADELAAGSLSLEPGEQVDVQVRRVIGEDVIVGAPGMVDHVGRPLIRRPRIPVAGVRLPVATAQRRPPALFQPLLEGPGVQGAEAVPAHPELVLRHERQGRLEQAVRRRVEITEQIRIPVQRRRVVTALPGAQADPVQVTEVTGAVPTDDHGGAARDR
jgi:hypothetical protein